MKIGSFNREVSLPPLPGVGYKPQHFNDICNSPGSVAWLEIHAENYMGDGGRPRSQLLKLRENFPFSCHGVGLSIGGEEPLDREHLARLGQILSWLQPAAFSEHLAWSTHDGCFFNDLLPLPYNERTLSRVCEHIDDVQSTLNREMLLENPSTYLDFDESEMNEIEFIENIAKRTDCGLLLDVNNVYVSSINQGFNPFDYLNGFPMALVSEIHLGGHESDVDENESELLIDSHNREVVDPVWDLYNHTIKLAGAKPTLIEWDSDIPEWNILEAEARRASEIMAGVPAKVPECV